MKTWIFSLIPFGLLIGCLCLPSEEGTIEPWQGKHWQGDIELTAEQKAILSGAPQTSSTGILDRFISYRWPKVGNYVWVPLMFDESGNFSEAQKSLIWKDLRPLEKKTCVRFIQRTKQTDFIRIFNGTGCYSRLGKVGGMQNISLQNPSCVRPGTPVHEFIHALGYTHMHNHIDRDDYLTVHLENTANDAQLRSNFDKADPNIFGNFNTTYDFYSVMHYSRRAGSNNGQDVLVPKDISFIDIIGTYRNVSLGDIDRVNNMYKCQL